MALCNRLDEREPQAHTAHTLTGPRQSEKGLKDPLSVVRGHARTMITHPDSNRLALLSQAQGNALAFCGFVAAGTVPPCVFQQVAHQAAQQLGHPQHL